MQNETLALMLYLDSCFLGEVENNSLTLKSKLTALLLLLSTQKIQLQWHPEPYLIQIWKPNPCIMIIIIKCDTHI